MITTQIEGMDYLSLLSGEIALDYTTIVDYPPSNTKSVDDIIDDLLTYQLKVPPITKGTIAPAYAGITREVKSESDSILKILLSLQETIGGYIEVDNDRKLNWYETIGEDKGQQIRYGKNLAGITRDIDYTLLINRLYAYGISKDMTTGEDIRLKLSQISIYAVKKYLKSDMSFVDQTFDLSGSIIRALTVDANYAYAGSEAPSLALLHENLIRKYLISDLSNISSVSIWGELYFGVPLYALTDDTDNIYMGDLRVKKILKSNLSLVTQSPIYDSYSPIFALTADATHVYAGGGFTSGPISLGKMVKKYLSSDLSYVDESASYGGIIYALCEDTDYVYAGGGTTHTVRKYAKTDMSLADESPDYGGIIYALCEDTDYVYAGGGVTQTVRQYDKTDMSLVAESPAYGGVIRALTGDATHIYAAGDTGIIKRYLKADMTYVDESPNYGAPIYALANDTDNVYAGGDKSALNDYLEDTDSQAQWKGIYPGVLVNKDISTLPTLLSFAQLKLAEMKNPPITYRVDTLDLSVHSGFDFEALQLGSIVTVIDEDLGIDVKVQIVKIEHPDLLDPQQMIVELANKTKDISDTLTKFYSFFRTY